MESFLVLSLNVLPAKSRNKIISAPANIKISEAVKVQFSDPYKNVGKTKVLCNFNIISVLTFLKIVLLTFILLMWTFGRAPNHASKWEMGFNSVA
jgi:hypothetical protein